jgi:poly(U)-specific endoribonuclease
MDETNHLLKIQFTYQGQLKPLSSVMFGVSPEFELILYTLVYLSGKDKVSCTIDDLDCSIVLHKYRSAGKESIGTAYVDILE